MRRKKKTLKTVKEGQPLTDDSSEEDEIELSDIPNFPKTITKSNTPQSTDIESVNSEGFDLESEPIIISEENDKGANYRIINGSPEFGELKELICEKFAQVLNIIANVSLHVDDINRRLDKMERESKKSTNIRYEDIEELIAFLPIKAIQEMESFEDLVSTKNKRLNLLKYLSNIGGTNTKENIIRVLKKVFSNRFAMKCSWLGQRNNFKVCDLRTISIIKGTVSENFPHSDKEFENVTSEWFRQAKQRLTRENKSLPINE